MVRVCEGDVVQVRLDTGQEHAICISSDERKADKPGVLSLSSGAPLSMALLGATLGDKVAYTVAGVQKNASVVKITPAKRMV